MTFQINTRSKTTLVSNADVARDVFLYFFTLTMLTKVRLCFSVNVKAFGGYKGFTIILDPVPNPLKDGALDPNLYPGSHLLERTVVLICTGDIYKSRNPIHLFCHLTFSFDLRPSHLHSLSEG